MNPLTIARIAGGVVAAAIAAWLIWAVNDRYKLAGEVRQHQACLAAVAKPDVPLTACAPAIAEQVDRARLAAGCDDALHRGGVVAIRALCSAEVKTIVADRDAKAGNLDDANRQIREAQARQDAAVSRAEARALSTAERKAANDRTIQSAPRTADGSVRCDAECLRALARS